MTSKTMSTTTYATVIATSILAATTPIIAGSNLTAPECAPCNTANSTNCSTVTVQGTTGSGIASCTGESSSTIFWTDLLQKNYTWILIGFAAALVLMLIAKILICLRKCCRKKSPSGTEDDRNKNTDQAEFKNDVTLTPHIYSSEPLVNASHHPPTYELVSESASPYAEVNGPDETTSPCSLYSEVALVRAPTCRPKSQAVKNGTTNAEESVSAGSTTVKIETTENLYDDAATIGAALERLPTQTGNTSDNCEPATGVEDTVAPVYCDVNRIKETPTPDIKDQKPTSPFAMNYANTIKSLAQKFKPPSNDLKADNGDAIYDDAAIVKMNDTKTNADTQYDDADNVYQEASAVKLERLADSKKTNDAQMCQVKHSNNPTKGNHVEHGTEMRSEEEDMTLVENTLYGEMKGK